MAAIGETIYVSNAAAASGTPATAITGLSSRQLVYGSPTGGVAQSANAQFDSTQGFLGLGTSGPVSRLHVIGELATGLSSASASIFNQVDTAFALILRRSNNQAQSIFGVQTSAAAYLMLIDPSGRVQAGNGSSGSPGLSFANQTGLGIWADRTGFAAAGGGNNAVVTFGSSGTTAQLGFFSTATVSQASSYTVPSTVVFSTANRSIATTISTNSTNLTPWGFATSAAFNSWQNAIIELQQTVSNLVRDLGVSQGGYGLFK